MPTVANAIKLGGEEISGRTLVAAMTQGKRRQQPRLICLKALAEGQPIVFRVGF